MTVLFFFLVLQVFAEKYEPSGEGTCVYHVSPSKGCGDGPKHRSTTVLPGWRAGIEILDWEEEASRRRVTLNGGTGTTGAVSIAATLSGSFGRFGNNINVKDLGVAGSSFFVNMEALRDDAFPIVSYQSGDCIQVPGRSLEADSEVGLGACDMDSWNGRLVALHARQMGRAAYLVFAHSGLCLSPIGGSHVAGVRLSQRRCRVDDTSQMWAVVAMGQDISYIVNVATGLAVQTVAHQKSYGYNNEKEVIVSPRRDDDIVNQAWSPWTAYLSSLGLTGGIAKGYPDLPEHVTSTTSQPRTIDIGYGMTLTTAGKVGTTNNVEYYAIAGLGDDGSEFRPQYLENVAGSVQFMGAQSGKCWNIATKKPNHFLDILTCDSSTPNQRIFIVHTACGYFYLILAHSGLCLGSLKDDDDVGNNVVQNVCRVNNPHQLWQFEEGPPGSGQFYIRQKSSNLTMDMEARGRKDGTHCILWNRHSGDDFALNQLFVRLH